MRKVFQIIFLSIILGIFGNFPVGAAGGDFSLDLIPKNPAPDTAVTAKVSTYQFDADRSKVTWEIDGKVVASGLGEKSVKFISPALGKQRKISAYVTTNDGTQTAKSIVLVGNDVDLLWEALTYTPPTYKGRSLPVLGSPVKMTAIPYLYSKGSLISGANLIYEWSVDYKKDLRSSGAGKNSVTFQINNYDDYVVNLRVSNPDESVVFEKGIILSVDEMKTEPKIVFYEDNPLEGTKYNEALGASMVLDSEEIGLRAEPYFFNIRDLGKLSYEWMMNGQKAVPDQAPNVLSLRKGEKSGKSAIGLSINNPVSVLQSAGGGLEIKY